MAIGRTDMYIMIRYETCTPGWRSARLMTAKPAVRVEVAWNIPLKTCIPAGKVVTVGSPNYCSCQLPASSLKNSLLTSSMMKKNRSTTFKITSIQKSHQFALLGNSRVKQRRG